MEAVSQKCITRIVKVHVSLIPLCALPGFLGVREA